MRALPSLLLCVALVVVSGATPSDPVSLSAQEPKPVAVDTLDLATGKIKEFSQVSREAISDSQGLKESIADLQGNNPSPRPTAAQAPPVSEETPKTVLAQQAPEVGSAPVVGHTIEIKGPAIASLGQAVFLEVAGVDADDDIKWTVLPEGAQYFDSITRDGRYIVVFTSNTGGTFYLVLSQYSEGHLHAVSHSIQVGGPGPIPPGPNPPGPGPGPGPNPPPPPVLTGLAKQVFDRSVQVGDKAGAATLAQNYDQFISAINAGAYPGDYMTASTKMMTDIAQANRPTLQANQKWQGFFTDLMNWMMNLETTGQMKSMADVSRYFGEIRDGLAAASK